MSVDQAMFVLRLQEGSDPEEKDVNRAYRRLVLQYHPDNKLTGNDMKFKLLNKAKEVMLKSLEPENEIEIEAPKVVEYGKLRLVPNDIQKAQKPPWGDWVKKEWK